jgi:hypothetical protein
MMKESSLAHQSMMKSFEMPDERSFGVFNALKDAYPAFAEKLFEGNEIMKRLVMSGQNPMDILDYPICGRCETIAPYNGYAKKNGRLVNKCTCIKENCSHTTIDPITLRKWLKYELKKKVTGEDFFIAIEYSIDAIAATMILKQIQDASGIMKIKSASDREKLGITDDSFEQMTETKPDIQHLRNNAPSMPKNAEEIQDEIEED